MSMGNKNLKPKQKTKELLNGAGNEGTQIPGDGTNLIESGIRRRMLAKELKVALRESPWEGWKKHD